MDNKHVELDSIVKDFVNFTLEQKLDLLVEQLKQTAITVQQMCDNYGSGNEVYINRELVDINKDDVTVDDYIEAMEVYVLSIQQSLNDFSIAEDKFLNLMDEVLPKDSNAQKSFYNFIVMNFFFCYNNIDNRDIR